MSATIYIIGIGPGSSSQMTSAAVEAISKSEVIAGYKTYVDLLGNLKDGKKIISSAMTQEVQRCQAAIDEAEKGCAVAVISSGDAGIYGMAGLIFELLGKTGWKPGDSPEVCVIPGVSSLGAAASLLGAPLMHDFAVVSLSDLLTPWNLIEQRIECAAEADFVMVLYNPASKKRVSQIKKCQKLILKYRQATTPAGIVTNAYRQGEVIITTTLGKMTEHEIAMTTTIIIGNSNTFFIDRLLVTPRGYKIT